MARVQVSISIARQDVYDRTVLPAKNTGDLNKLISTLLTVYTDFQEVRQLVDGASLGEKRRQQGEIQDLFSKMRETLEVQAEELIETATSNQAFEDSLGQGGGSGGSGSRGSGSEPSGTEAPKVMDMLQKILSKVEGLYGDGSEDDREGSNPTGKRGFVGGPEDNVGAKQEFTPVEEPTGVGEEFTLGDSVNIEGGESPKEEPPAEEETADEDLSESFLSSLMDSVGL